MFTKRLAKQITSLVLCTMLMLLMVVPGFATESEGNVTTIKSLRFVDLITEITKVDASGEALAEKAEGFSHEWRNYTAKFPYVKDTDSFYVPKIEVETTDPAATYVVNYPDDITKGAITIVVTGANGVPGQPYQITGVTAGENLYVDGDFESGLAVNSNGSALVKGQDNVWARYSGYVPVLSLVDDAATGSKAMKVVGSDYSNIWQGMLKDDASLEAGKKYYASMQAKLADSAEVDSHETRHLFNKAGDATQTQYNDDGTQKSNANVTVIKDEYTEMRMVLIPASAYKPVRQVLLQKSSDSDKTAPDYVVDDYYIGELVVSKIAVTNENGASSESVALGEGKTITLSAKPINQYGNVAGLEALTVSEWRMVENTAGVTVSNGVVTVPANAPAGKYYVEALIDTSSVLSAGQGTVKGVFAITVSDGTLMSLTVSAPHVIDFETGTRNYTLDVPAVHVEGQDTYTMPVVSAVVANPDEHKVDEEDIVYPDTVADGEKIYVYVKDKDNTIVDTYTLTLNTVGENLYVDGDFESGLAVNSKGSALVKGQDNVWARYSGSVPVLSLVDDAATGSKAMKVVGSTYDNIWQGMLKDDASLEKDKKYYASMQAKLADSAEVDSHETRYFFNKASGATQTHYNDDGTQKSDAYVTVIKDEYTEMRMVLIPASAYKPVRQVLLQKSSDSDKTAPDYVVDDYYIGELVVSEVAITSENIDVTKKIASPAEAMNITLTSKLLNQYQTVAGLEDIEASLSLVGAPAVVELTGSELTIPAGFTGAITVRADANLTGLTQTKVYGELTLIVGETGITGNIDEETGVATCKLMYVNDKAEEVSVYFVTALYEKNESGILKLVSTTTPKTGVCLAEDKIYSDTQTIEVPNTVGKTYVVKAFAWKNDGTYYPLMQSETLE